jgi:phosphate transport system ATP-binding protein
MSPALAVKNLNVWYGGQHALKNIDLNIPAKQITAIIGPSGCGKSTLLKSFNRLLDLNDAVKVTGEIWLDGENIYSPTAEVTTVRTHIGLLGQKPFPLPMSIYDNVAYAPRLHGFAKQSLPQLVESKLKAVGLWSEVSERLNTPATKLSVGQQQRLCLARTLSISPDILLCDESTASLDPLSARGIEALLGSLRGDYTIVLVTHDIEQARRLADYVVFMWLGELVEKGPSAAFFNNPQMALTQQYLTRQIG